MYCPICNSRETKEYFLNRLHHFFRCDDCNTVFRNPENFISSEEEKARYETHNNDVNDPRYQTFVNPIISAVKNNFKTGSKGLDYGAGTGPVIAKLLNEAGYDIHLYDPFFHSNEDVLELTYDFIVCCEVIEHFHYPMQEFRKLHALLNPGGILFCMTELLDATNFEAWYYKDDPTHVVFYEANNLKKICDSAGFSELSIDGRLISLRK